MGHRPEPLQSGNGATCEVVGGEWVIGGKSSVCDPVHQCTQERRGHAADRWRYSGWFGSMDDCIAYSVKTEQCLGEILAESRESLGVLTELADSLKGCFM